MKSGEREETNMLKLSMQPLLSSLPKISIFCGEWDKF